MRVITMLTRRMKWNVLGVTYFVVTLPTTTKLGQVVMFALVMNHIVAILVCFVVFCLGTNWVINRSKHNGAALDWMLATVITDIQIPDKNANPKINPFDEQKLTLMKEWCDKNCTGQWRHCLYGYFIFKKKSDALAFKLAWV